MSTDTKKVPKPRIRRGDWSDIATEYNAEYCKNRSIDALRQAWHRGEPEVLEFVSGFLDRKTTKINEILGRLACQARGVTA